MPSKIQQKNGRRKDPTTPPNRSNFLLQTRLFELIKERYPSEKLLDQHFILLRCTPLPNPQCLIEDITSPLKTGTVIATCFLRGKVCSVGAKMLEACSFDLYEQLLINPSHACHLDQHWEYLCKVQHWLMHADVSAILTTSLQKIRVARGGTPMSAVKQPLSLPPSS